MATSRSTRRNRSAFEAAEGVLSSILSSMSFKTTTIKVPVSLRDRLAVHAKRDSVPLAVVIDQALSSFEEGDFWASVTAENREIGESERTAYVANTALGDDLNDHEDEVISAEDRW